MLPLITAIVVFCTILFLILGLISGRSNAGSLARQRLEAFKRGGGEPEAAGTERAGFGARVVSPMFGGAARGLGNVLPRSMMRSVERQLVTAGGPRTMNGFLTRALRDIALGKSRRDALKELGTRTNVPDLVQFTNAVVQAEAMGSSIGTVLRVQAEQLRVKRRQRAEEAAYKAPVKMLFPLVLCIFPTLFIVILGPAVITIMHGFPTK